MVHLLSALTLGLNNCKVTLCLSLELRIVTTQELDCHLGAVQ